MRIAFYMPFKPLGHPDPSGDLITGAGLYSYLREQGHHLYMVSDLRTRWIYWKPWLWPLFVGETVRVNRLLGRTRPDIWITYHSYYKSPDMLGMECCRSLGIPYVIFQGIFSTKRRRRLKSLPGYILNTMALSRADLVFTNKRNDEKNLKRIVPGDRLFYVRPGIDPGRFPFDETARRDSRRLWQVGGDEPVVLSAAMLRPGVKARGIRLVIESCSRLFRQGLRFKLVIAGDGKERRRLETLARKHLPGRALFLGKVNPGEMRRFYSGGDLFVFPGIQESLGVVYLEAQSCRLPVVALSAWGASEAVIHGETGLLSHPDQMDRFTDSIALLLRDRGLRARMGISAERHVRKNHDARKNYRIMEDILLRKAGEP
ncbi:MAG: glycosyltransferase family 4 protein [Deltaproteobacteria bacterium]|nr:glycosyltransferase family 4 protein [Deltaproteobacteria bacterium]